MTRPENRTPGIQLGHGRSNQSDNIRSGLHFSLAETRSYIQMHSSTLAITMSSAEKEENNAPTPINNQLTHWVSIVLATTAAE